MSEDDLVPISALQHYLYCPWQWALIHLEQIWTENVLTAQGRLLHQRSDRPTSEQRKGVRSVTAMRLQSLEHGLVGVADVVEFHQQNDGTERVFPVEYKRGKPKAHRADEVQLCAQALCLESMLGVKVEEGAIFYGATRRRCLVHLDDELRELTLHVVRALQDLMMTGKTPSAKYDAGRCDRCSLIDDCQPKWTGMERDVNEWLDQQLGVLGAE